MWRALGSDEANDDGGSGTSDSITSTSYTIHGLGSLTIYNITITAINTVGITVSQPIIISSMTLTRSHTLTRCHYIITPSFLYLALTVTDSQADNGAAVTGWVVAVIFIITTVAAVIVIVILLLRNCRGNYSTGTQKMYNFMCSVLLVS